MWRNKNSVSCKKYFVKPIYSQTYWNNVDFTKLFLIMRWLLYTEVSWYWYQNFREINYLVKTLIRRKKCWFFRKNRDRVLVLISRCGNYVQHRNLLSHFFQKISWKLLAKELITRKKTSLRVSFSDCHTCAFSHCALHFDKNSVKPTFFYGV